MADVSGAGDTSLLLSLEQRVDEVCLRYEQAWKAGGRPRPEDFLERAVGPERWALLRELVALEVEYRRRRGEDPRPEEYQRRFPELPPDRIDDLLGTSPGGSAAAPAASQGTERDQQATGDYSPDGVQTFGPGPQGAGGGTPEADTPAPDRTGAPGEGTPAAPPPGT